MSELDALLAEREKYVKSLFSSIFYILFILLGPSIVAALIGNEINKKYATGSGFTFLMVLFVIFFSWFFIFKIYKNIDHKMTDLDSKIKEEKAKINYESGINK